MKFHENCFVLANQRVTAVQKPEDVKIAEPRPVLNMDLIKQAVLSGMFRCTVLRKRLEPQDYGVNCSSPENELSESNFDDSNSHIITSVSVPQQIVGEGETGSPDIGVLPDDRESSSSDGVNEPSDDNEERRSVSSANQQGDYENDVDSSGIEQNEIGGREMNSNQHDVDSSDRGSNTPVVVINGDAIDREEISAENESSETNCEDVKTGVISHATETNENATSLQLLAVVPFVRRRVHFSPTFMNAILPSVNMMVQETVFFPNAFSQYKPPSDPDVSALQTEPKETTNQ